MSVNSSSYSKIMEREFQCYTMVAYHNLQEQKGFLITTLNVVKIASGILADSVRGIGYLLHLYKCDGVPFWFPVVVILQAKHDPVGAFNDYYSTFDLKQLKKNTRCYVSGNR